MPTKKPTPLHQTDQQHLATLINSMSDGVIATDKDFKVLLHNAAALDILDLHNLHTGSDISDVVKLIDRDNQEIAVTHLVKESTTSTTSRDHRIQYQDGSKINIFISIAPVHLGYGKNSNHGYIIVLRDITHEKSLEEERDEFISVISHELRTPVAIAEGNLSNAQYISKKHPSPPEITTSLQQAYDQIAFLSGMINDLSMLSRAENGATAVETSPVNVRKLIESLMQAYTPAATEKQLGLHAELDPKLELVHTNELYLREILQNLVTNAIKYTEQGSVTIAAKQTSKGVNIAVHDTGIGISKSDQAKIFTKFFRAEDYKTRQHSGTGLGLYVAAKLASLLQATITVDGAPQKGSSFILNIPN